MAGGAWLTGFDKLPDQPRATDEPTGEIEEPFRHGRKLGVVPFTEEAPVPMGQAFGAELDRRLYTDFSQLTPQNIITPTKDFYIRTGASQFLSQAKLASIKVSGLVRQPFSLDVADFARQAKPMGSHLMECAGNARAVHFGMMSVAEWTGLPVSPIVENAGLKSSANRVLISGFDQYATTSTTSVPGASWTFTLHELKSAGAFLATEMNGQPLEKDHGAPIRLVAPGWYGCTCIKWVKEVTIVDDDARATSQMLEYASRTLQKGVPQLARDYEPATIDPAAMPIRVEKWVVDGQIMYRVVGILWGGSRPVRTLEIRFNPDDNYVPVPSLQRSVNDSWRLWTHPWTPKRNDTYMIRLRAKTDGQPTRRMDAGYYIRTVEIRET